MTFYIFFYVCFILCTGSAMETKLFVVISHPRSGSNYFCNDLKIKLSPHGVMTYNEVFHPSYILINETRETSFASNYSLDERNKHPDIFLDFLGKESAKAGHWAYGFKLFPYHVSNDFVSYLLKNSSIVKVIIYRPDVLQVYISHMKAKQFNSGWIGTNTTGQQVRIDMHALERYVERYDQWFERVIRDSVGHVLIVSYVSYVRSNAWRARIALQLLNYLRSNDHAHETPLELIKGESLVEKQSAANTWDSIKNIEIKRVLCNHPRFSYACK